MRRRRLICLAGAVTASLALPAAGRAEPPECNVPPELMQVSVRLPQVAQRLAAKEPVKIVAVGGGSTLGRAAGSPEHAYPHRLELALKALYPDVEITVLNKGIPRQSTQQMAARFDTDVFPENPVLVIWEAGVNDAVRGIDIDSFATALQDGIDAVKHRTIDIVMVDMQFSRNTTAVIDFQRYLDTIHRTADVNELYVFPRFEMMRYWSEQHIFNLDEVAAEDRAKLAASVYDCIGRKLAEAIRLAVQ